MLFQVFLLIKLVYVKNNLDCLQYLGTAVLLFAWNQKILKLYHFCIIPTHWVLWPEVFANIIILNCWKLILLHCWLVNNSTIHSDFNVQHCCWLTCNFLINRRWWSVFICVIIFYILPRSYNFELLYNLIISCEFLSFIRFPLEL